MKTAISLPDDLFDRAERAAARLGRSRSALYAAALASYLDAAEVSDEVTDALDALYTATAEPDGRTRGAAAGRALVDSGQWEW